MNVREEEGVVVSWEWVRRAADSGMWIAEVGVEAVVRLKLAWIGDAALRGGLIVPSEREDEGEFDGDESDNSGVE